MPSLGEKKKTPVHNWNCYDKDAKWLRQKNGPYVLCEVRNKMNLDLCLNKQSAF